MNENLFSPRLFLATLLLLCSFANGQSIIFNEYSHNFGKLREAQEEVTYQFTFTNEGRKPIEVTKVTPSCGCTVTEWKKGPINPKESGYINVSLNISGMEGSITKTVTVFSDSEPEMVVLSLKAHVIPKPPGLKEKYPIASGNIRFAATYFSFGDCWHNGTAEAGFTAVNLSSEKIDLFLSESSIPASIRFTEEKLSISPKDSVFVKAIFLADSVDEWGQYYDYFTLKTSDLQEPEKRMHYKVNIKEKFTENALSLPHPTLSVNKEEHDFGIISNDKLQYTSFSIKNTGNEQLILRRAHSPCGCTLTAPEENVLVPGESTEIKVTYSPKNDSGDFRKSITLISNDPANPEMILWLTGTIEK